MSKFLVLACSTVAFAQAEEPAEVETEIPYRPDPEGMLKSASEKFYELKDSLFGLFSVFIQKISQIHFQVCVVLFRFLYFVIQGSNEEEAKEGNPHQEEA